MTNGDSWPCLPGLGWIPLQRSIRAKEGQAALARAQHRLNLERAGCQSLWLFVASVESASVIQEIDEMLPSGSVYTLYTKDKTEHQVILHRFEDAEDGSMSYSAHWSAARYRLPFTRVKAPLWRALDLVQSIAKRVDAQCLFSFEHERFEPKLSIPLKPFSEGLLPFNEIGGYRAVRTEEGRRIWDAVIDREEDGNYTMALTMDDYSGDDALTTEGVFRQLIGIRDTLLIEKTHA